MCGISGIIKTTPSDSEEMIKKVEEMLLLSSHRGPDAMHVKQVNNSFLGHSRLSVIDLSDEADQPMSFEGLTIVFNGEIYNYIEIRRVLKTLGYTFVTKSDTEVLLKAYHCWQNECLSRLNGMFSFAIFNSETNSLFMARDRIGEKPLYYAKDENTFYFASEIKQLVKSGLVKTSADIAAIQEYLVMQYTLGDHTFFQNIYKLMPGHYMEVSDNTIRIECYWSVDSIELEHTFTPEKCKSQLYDTLKDAINMRLRSDVSLGTYLSGGIDSTIISSFASELKNEKLSTYTFSSDNKQFDETPLARKTSDHLKAENRVSQLQVNDFMKLWRECTYLMDEPAVGYSLIPQYIMSKKVSNYTTVILGGQGGDELFFGYGWHSTLLMISMKDLLKKNVGSIIGFLLKYFSIRDLRALYRQIRQLLKISWFNFSKSYFNLWSLNTCAPILLPEIKDNVYRSFKETFEIKNHTLPLNRVRNFELKYWLPGLLHVEDRSSMGASIESRCPILDHRVIELALSIPASESIDGNINKVFLKEALAKKIPNWILNKKEKFGYTVPLNDWLQTNEVQKYIQQCHHGERKIFLETFLPKGYDLSQYTVRQIWMLLSIVIWAEEFNMIKTDG